jgi:malonyl-CoA/methylmalonyl-CoA synthetase
MMDRSRAHLLDLFSASLRDRAEKVGLVWGEERITFGELNRRSDALAAGLVKLGVQRGDRVGIFAGNSVEFALTYLAHLRLGAITVPMNVLYRAGEITHIVSDAGVRLITTDGERLPVLLECREALPTVEKILVADGESWREAAACEDAPPAVEITPEDLALIIYTSGTTGRAKGAMLSHANLAANIRALIEAWRLSADDVFLLTLPLFHLHGLGVGLHGWLATGMTTILHPRFHAETALTALRTHRCTLFMGVPTMYARLLEQARGERQELPDMRLFVSGSAPLAAERHAEFERIFGHRILERYGMTETGMNLSNPYEGERRPGSVGLPLPGVELRIVDDEMKDLAPGEVGQLALRGPNVFGGYWRDEAKTREAFRDGWFLTGDLGSRDHDGYVTLVGRAKEMIISGGFNVYPREIEEVLCGHPGVVEAKCIGVPDPLKGEVVKAYVVRAPRSRVTAKKLIALCRERLASFKVPRAVQFLSALPRNAMGKVVADELPNRTRL